MNDEIGKIIRESRIRAGFTQKKLANSLHVTDKAVSKWERGICLPEVTLLQKMSIILDVDLDVLVSKSVEENEWVGLIDIEDCDFSQVVFDKPLAYYLLSHFLLLGITRINVFCTENNQKYLQNTHYSELGFSFSFNEQTHNKLMILDHPWFLFGSDLTQQFQGAMMSGRNTKVIPDNQGPVFFFAIDGYDYFCDKKRFIKNANKRTLGRGMVCFDMHNPDSILEVASFIKSYQNNSGLLIGSLEEIAFRKGLVTEAQLLEMSKNVSYERLLLKCR